MNILFATDENYLEPLYTLINSIASNNKAKINFYLLYSDICEDKLNELIKYVKKDGNNIIPIFVNTNIFDEVYLIHYITKTTFYRLLIHDLLPENIDRILYLDADIVVNGSLEEVYNSEFEGKLICAIKDKPYNPSFHSSNDRNKSRLNIISNHIYFNAGVILFNLKLIRSEIDTNAYSKFLCYILKQNLLLGDQDIFNVYFENKTKYLSEKYNYRPRFYYKFKTFKPVIIHYYGSEKPWQNEYCHEYKSIYYKYAEDRIENRASNIETNIYKLKLLARKSKTFLKIILYKLTLYRSLK